MSLVVVGVTGATMWVTQSRVQASYQKLFEEQFKAQISFFSQRQVSRLQTAARLSTEAVADPALVAEMEQEAPNAERVYGALMSAFATSFRNSVARGAVANEGGRPDAELPGQGPGPPNPGGEEGQADRGGGPGENGGPPRSGPGAEDTRSGGRAVRGRGAVPLVRMLDASGQSITPPEESGSRNALRRLQGEHLAEYLRTRNAAPVDQQETGYLVIDSDRGQPQLYEFIISPVRKPEGGALLGALVAASPVDFGERAMFDASSHSETGQITSGIWIDGQLYTETITETQRQEIAADVVRELESSEQSGRFDVTDKVSGQPVRVLYRILNPESPFGEAVHVSVFAMTDLLREEKDLRLRIGGFGLLALAGAMLAIWLISHGLTLPMKELVAGAEAVGRGEFEVRVPVRSRDEVGQLVVAFNDMAAGLAKGRRYQTVLAQVSDPHVAEELIRNPARLGGQLLTVSVLFCDIRGFTAITAGMPPQEVIGLLNEHMSALADVVQECGGVVDKFAGDMIMALFGAPQSHGHDAESAARCALRMIEARRELNRHSAYQIEVGIGLATGEVVAGCMGSENRLNYTVLGERVNLGSRLCGKAKSGEILMDESTLTALGPAALSTALTPAALKGFAEPVPVWRLEGLA